MVHNVRRISEAAWEYAKKRLIEAQWSPEQISGGAKVANKSAQAVSGAIHREMLPLSALVHTITVDNGKEFANHVSRAEALDAMVYFTRPYHSWERGSNESTNGLVRQHFSKGMSFSVCSYGPRR